MKKVFFLLPLIFVFLVSFSFAEDSPLVQAAKREKERREKLKQPAKVLTNQDIQKFKEKQGDTAESTQTQESTPADGTIPADQTAADQNKGKKEKGAWDDEEYWRSRSADASRAVEEAQKKVDDIQNDVDTLWRAQTAVDDGQQKQLVTSQRGEKMSDLEKAKADLQAAQQAQQALQEEARKAGAPPGWVDNQ
jgi:hypothetical protein